MSKTQTRGNPQQPITLSLGQRVCLCVSCSLKKVVQALTHTERVYVKVELASGATQLAVTSLPIARIH